MPMIRKIVLMIAILALGYTGFVLLNLANSIKTSRPALDLSPRNAHAAVCYLTEENQEEGSSYKYCHYECLNGSYILTIDIMELCPLTITR